MFEIAKRLAQAVTDKTGLACFVEPFKVVPDAPHYRLTLVSIAPALNGLQSAVRFRLIFVVKGSAPEAATTVIGRNAYRLSRWALDHKPVEFAPGLKAYVSLVPGTRNGWSQPGDEEKSDAPVFTGEYFLDLEFDTQELESYLEERES